MVLLMKTVDGDIIPIPKMRQKIDKLENNFYTDNEDLQGIAAIAVSILSNINEGRRKLLYKFLEID